MQYKPCSYHRLILPRFNTSSETISGSYNRRHRVHSGSLTANARQIPGQYHRYWYNIVEMLMVRNYIKFRRHCVGYILKIVINFDVEGRFQGHPRRG